MFFIMLVGTVLTAITSWHCSC